MKKLLLILYCLPLLAFGDARTTLSLNGEWDFQRTDTAMPPAEYKHKISVPGLVHLATPRIDQYDTFFKRPDRVELAEQSNFLERKYTPRYNWYRKEIQLDESLKNQQLWLTAEYHPQGKNEAVASRRYLKVGAGETGHYKFHKTAP